MEKTNELNITSIELNDKGQTIAIKGTFKKKGKKVLTNKNFSPKTNNTLFWAELELDYIEG